MILFLQLPCYPVVRLTIRSGASFNWISLTCGTSCGVINHGCLNFNEPWCNSFACLINIHVAIMISIHHCSIERGKERVFTFVANVWQINTRCKDRESLCSPDDRWVNIEEDFFLHFFSVRNLYNKYIWLLCSFFGSFNVKCYFSNIKWISKKNFQFSVLLYANI